MPDWTLALQPCPKGIAEHVRVKVYTYPPKEHGQSPVRAIICLDCKSLREKEVRSGRSPKSPHAARKGGIRETFQRHAKIAGLLGAGMPIEQIAEKVGLQVSTVTVIKKAIPKNEELRKILDEARMQAAMATVPKALAATDTLLDLTMERARGYEDTVGVSREGNAVMGHRTPGPRELASALYTVSSIAGMVRQSNGNIQALEATTGSPMNHAAGSITLSIEVLKDLMQWRDDLRDRKVRTIEIEKGS